MKQSLIYLYQSSSNLIRKYHIRCLHATQILLESIHSIPSGRANLIGPLTSNLSSTESSYVKSNISQHISNYAEFNHDDNETEGTFEATSNDVKSLVGGFSQWMDFQGPRGWA
jgi:hypothetical protein